MIVDYIELNKDEIEYDMLTIKKMKMNKLKKMVQKESKIVITSTRGLK